VRIAYIVTRSDPIGGAQVHVRDLTRAMRDHGHEAVVIAGGTGPFTTALQAQGVPTVILRHLVAPIAPLKDARALHEIRAALRKLRPDLLSTHSSKAGILGRVVARSLGVPVVFTAHGWAFTPGIPTLQAALYRRIERIAAPLANRIITVSNFDRELALAVGIGSDRQVITVHNGMPDVNSDLRADPGRHPVRLVMVARFEPQKDHPTLLKALAGLRELQWELDLIGDGPLLPEMQRLCGELAISQQVRFWGQRMDVDARLADAQICLLISNWEGFPRSILEAMRAGLPVIASKVGGSSESVVDGETGFLAARGDVELLRTRLERLLTDAELRRRLGAAGRERYEQHFTLGHTVAKTLAVYQQILAEHQSAHDGRRLTPANDHG
jgi:glycosyltransferase involved in cell wall biosynthesis